MPPKVSSAAKGRLELAGQPGIGRLHPGAQHLGLATGRLPGLVQPAPDTLGLGRVGIEFAGQGRQGPTEVGGHMPGRPSRGVELAGEMPAAGRHLPDVAAQGLDAAGLGVIEAFDGRDQKDDRRGDAARPGQFPQPGGVDRDLLGTGQIGLVEDKGHVASPGSGHQIEKLPGRPGIGIERRKNEQHQIGPGK